MKIFSGILFLFLFSFNNANAQQTTWVKTLNYDNGTVYYHRYDSLWVGPAEIAVTPDNRFHVINNDDREGKQSLHHFYPSGGSGSGIVGYYSTLSYHRAYGLVATPDSGCVFIDYFNDFGGPIPGFKSYSLKKVKYSAVSTIHTWTNDPVTQDILSAIIPNYHNSYYCLVNNVWIDYYSGDTVNLYGCKHVFQNDDLLFGGSNITRKDTANGIVWSVPSNGYSVIACSENSIYAINGTLRKYDALTGAILWTRPLIANGQFCLHGSSDGLAVLSGRDITVIDSSGNMVNQNTIDFTYFPPDILASLPDGSLITGRSFLSGETYFMAPKGYSPVIIKLDSLTKGTVDSTTFFYYGDNDCDSTVAFYDDAVVVAAAFGNSNGHPELNNDQGICRQITYSASWADSFPSGLNYKYCDSNFDGVINQLDIIQCPVSPYTPLLHTDSTGEIITVITDNYFPAVGDTFNISILLGSQLNPMDSIYGISLNLFGRSSGQPHEYMYGFGNYELQNGILGDTTSNLFYYSPYAYHINGAVLCRTDHQDTTLMGDTILKVRAWIDPFTTPGPYLLWVAAHIISKNGYTIPHRTNFTSFNPILKVLNVHGESGITIFPNPTNEEVTISSEKNKIQKTIFRNIFGNILFQQDKPSFSHTFNVSNIPSGIYFVQSEFLEGVFVSKVFVEH